MTHPQFDSTQCSRDGLCVRACPSGTLRTGAEQLPETASDSTCIGCGHCVSVCPKMAVSLDTMAPERLEKLAGDWRIEPRRMSQFLKGRRSTRAYRNEAVDRSAILELIGIAQYAPSGHNTQPLGWTVVYERAEVRAIAAAAVDWMRRSVSEGSPYVAALSMPAVLAEWEAGRDGICRGAPHLILAHAPEALPSGAHAAAIAITYLELAAASLGLATCWAGFVLVGAGASTDLHASLGLPKGRRCAGAVLLGHPAVTYRRIPARHDPSISWR